MTFFVFESPKKFARVFCDFYRYYSAGGTPTPPSLEDFAECHGKTGNKGLTWADRKDAHFYFPPFPFWC